MIVRYSTSVVDVASVFIYRLFRHTAHRARFQVIALWESPAKYCCLCHFFCRIFVDFNYKNGRNDCFSDMLLVTKCRKIQLPIGSVATHLS